jgi:hypothetical protein
MRTVDGIHFRTMGALYVIEEIMQVIERHFILSPPSRDLARAERHTFESRLAGRPISYVAFIPNDADRRNRRPVVYVVPGAAANWREWPNYPHRDLQRASQAHDVVLVVLDGEMTADLIATEVLKDVETHLPVSDRRGLVGPDLLDLHAALTRRQIPVTFKHVDGVAFRSSLENQIAWHAEQLRSAGR